MNSPLASQLPVVSISLRPGIRRRRTSEMIAIALFIALLAAEVALIAFAAPSFDPLAEIYTVT